MSVSYGCAIVVGLPIKDMRMLDEDGLDKAINNGTLEHFGYYYDCGTDDDDSIVGYAVLKTFDNVSFDSTTVNDSVGKAFALFFDNYGVMPKLFLTNNIW